MRIAVLHHDASAAGRLSVALSKAGYRPVSFTQGPALVDSLTHEHFDLLVMRWDGPDLCGVAIMHRIRTRQGSPPAVLLIMTDDAPGGIGELADAQLPEPWEPDDLKAAVATAMAGRSIESGAQERFDSLVFDRASCQVMVRGHPVQLTAKEFALALMFMRNAGAALSRDEIMSSVWGRADLPGSRTLDAHVAQVRKRLALRPEHGWRLSSVYGFGYRLDRADRA